MNFRHASIEDAAQVAEIYNYYVVNSHSTFETKVVSIAEMQNRIGQIIENYPFLICENDGQILCYAYASPYKTREAYKHSTEVSVYIRNGAGGRGIGKRLYQKLLEEIARKNIHAIIAGIALPNEASVKLHERFGFEKVAHFREVGFKLGRWIDVGYWELINNKN